MKNYTYLIRRKVLTLFGAAFHVYDSNGGLYGYSRQKAFKLKEDIRLYADESKSEEVLHIQARNVIDFSAAYDVLDKNGCVLGTWQRKGFASLVRDSWVLSHNGVQIAALVEDNLFLSLVRRLLCNLIPQSYKLLQENNVIAEYAQCFNPFVFKLKVNIKPNGLVDSNLLLAGGILLTAIEGRQN